MKITFLLHELPSRPVGGVLSNIELMKALQRRGHECTFVYPKLAIYYQVLGHGRDRMKSQALRVLRCLKRTTSFPHDLGGVPALPIPYVAQKFLPKADILLISWWELAHQIQDYPPEKGKKVNIVRGHENHIEGLGKNRELEALINESYRLPGYTLIAISPHLKEVVGHASGSHVHGPIPNALNFEHFYRILQPRKNPFQIGVMCRHLPVKGFIDALEALLIVQRHHKFRLRIIGQNPFEVDCDKLHHFEDVVYDGYMAREQLGEYYNSLDLFLWTSREEGFGNPPLEAMACGCPVVSTKTGSLLTHAIEGETALLADPCDIERLANQTIRLIEDEPLRASIANAGYEHVQQYTWDRTAEEYEIILKEVIH